MTDGRSRREIRPAGCIACRHAQRAHVEALLVAGQSLRTVAERFGGGLNKDNLSRHMRSHMTRERRAELMVGPARVAELANAAADEFKEPARAVAGRQVGFVFAVPGLRRERRQFRRGDCRRPAARGPEGARSTDGRAPGSRRDLGDEQRRGPVCVAGVRTPARGAAAALPEASGSPGRRGRAVAQPGHYRVT